MDYISYITDGIKAICIRHRRRTAGSESVRTAEAESGSVRRAAQASPAAT